MAGKLRAVKQCYVIRLLGNWQGRSPTGDGVFPIATRTYQYALAPFGSANKSLNDRNPKMKRK